MIHIAETVGFGSVENFIDLAEQSHLTALMNDFLAARDRACFGSDRHVSIHEIPDHTAEQVMAVYEPAGRIEVPHIPDEAEVALQHAFERARPVLARVMPSITACRPWTYVEYGPGQHITSHLDGIAPDPLNWPRQIAGISVVITPAEAGGGFYVETASSDQLWHTRLTDATHYGYADGMWLAHDGADNSATWFQQMPRTRWNVEPGPGTALLYGSQLTHGTVPVLHGRAAKFISWLIADPAPDSAIDDRR
ncbi:hypothetical protein RMN57_12630 [Kitasatospora sp. CM 4170]|uniref:Fe2OG dioxygenase domain-containing protein n=1 Tax=Kitasatospora aburaviensis TaxID=67265 RepID=A0ABW1F283_9ACTN|nr:hypothetical protein [Kitasatospora sp. CM 4170]WNM45502.1 hypothetical protein RMN57_12630 [Kitasatospora sp. CM 4170]